MENMNTPGFSFDLPKGNSSIIKVIGVGGGGNNALKHMYERGIHGVDFVICNTDAQTLDNNPVANKVQLGVSITEGLGAGADPEVGEKAAIESIEEIKNALGQNTKMVFITAGMGGGTGTGAAPVIAKIAKEMGILTIGIVTIPFGFEGKRRLDQAENGLEKLRNSVDSLIVINNDKLRQQFGNLGFKSGFAKADEVLTNAAKGMAEVITGYFDVNIDFRDARSVLQNSGTALMSTGIASGENKAQDAVRKALDSPLLNDNKITGAKNVLLLIRSGVEEVTMDEIGVIMDHIQKEAGNTADIIFGVGTDEELGDSISVLVIATGFAKEHQKYAGPTERIVHQLNDEKSVIERTKSPFESSAPVEDKNIEQQPKTSRDLFFLDDEDNSPQPEFPINRFGEQQSRPQFQKEEVTEIKFMDTREEFSFGSNDWESESQQEYNLFTLNEREFELPQEESKNDFKLNIEEEKPVTFNFTNSAPSTPSQEEPQSKAGNPFSVQEKIELPPVENEFVITDKVDEYNIIAKPEDTLQGKAEERRNKLREFNARYNSSEAELDFENIPAFKRKNINLDLDNASGQNIENYFSDNNGYMQLRENKFLNKDVD